MSDLKSLFIGLGFKNVSTYINSGNLIFDSGQSNIIKLIEQIELALKKSILPIKVTVVSQSQLERNIKYAPKNWGKDVDTKHNLLFVRPPTTTDQVMTEIGTTKPEIETVTEGENVIYWSASIKEFGRTASSKLASKPIYQHVTVRNYNTSIKLLELMQ